MNFYSDVCEAEEVSYLSTKDCISDYNILTQDTDNYEPGWLKKNKNSTIPTIADPWTYQNLL